MLIYMHMIDLLYVTAVSAVSAVTGVTDVTAVSATTTVTTRGRSRGPVPPFQKKFCIYVIFTLCNMKISFRDV